jgi:predicted AAA+ superfamily ATPase
MNKNDPMSRRQYVDRLVDVVLDELLTSVPAVLLVGPRATGKTTTAERRTKSALRLGVRSQADAVLRDPDAVVDAAPRPVLIDEWQIVPDVLGVVKRAVDAGAVPGSYVLTGSSRADMQAVGWPATGRVLRVPMWGLIERELRGGQTDPSPIDVLFGGDLGQFRSLGAPLDLRDYIAAALRSGFPEAGRLNSVRAHRLWLSSYVDQLVLRDVAFASEQRDPQRLRRYLVAIAANTAGVVNHNTLYEAAGINRLTATAYDALLELLFITEQVPAWTNSRFSRLTQTTKRYLVEPALVMPLLNVDHRAVLRSADLLGRLIESFVVAQLRAECSIADTSPTMHHLRQANGRREVDVVLEGPAGAIVGIEIKSAAAVNLDDARHLIWLRDELDEQFAVGVVLHTGPLTFQLADRVWALPISSLWWGRRLPTEGTSEA